MCRRAEKEEIEPFKGATKLYFTHYIRVVIILFNTSLYKSAISTYACENFHVTINFYEKQWLLVLIWNKKHSSMQAVLKTYPPENKFLAPATFEGLRVLSFQAS